MKFPLSDENGYAKEPAQGLGQVGLVLGLEVSRLARNSSDWHHLLEMCALTQTLILDEEGLSDPSTFNDRLLLGFYVRYHQRPLLQRKLAHPDTSTPSK
jgi:hypothetical protein